MLRFRIIIRLNAAPPPILLALTMPSAPTTPPRRPMRVVLSATALLSFMSVRKAAALAIAQLGIGIFFLAGVTLPTLGSAAVAFAAAALVLAAMVRAIDIESWALFIPGGLVGRVRQAFGPRAATVAATASLFERLLLVSLVSVVLGHYAASGTLTAIGGWRFTGHVRHEDIATAVAALLIGFVWIRARQGLDFASDTVARMVWAAAGILALVIAAALVAGLVAGLPALPPAPRPPPLAPTGWSYIDRVLPYLIGLALVLPAIGGGDALARAAHDLPPPRVQALRRTSLVILLFIAGTVASVYLFEWIVPASEQGLWAQAPLVGLAQHLAAPAWINVLPDAGAHRVGGSASRARCPGGAR